MRARLLKVKDQRGPFDLGLVQAVDATKGRVKVQFPHRQGLTTRWLPFLARKTQNDKDFWLPDIGEMGPVLMDEYYEDGVYLGAIYSLPDAPPAGATADTYILQFSDGAILKYDRSSHTLTATLPNGGTATVTAPGGITANQVQIDASGNITTPGNITASGTITGTTDVKTATISLNNHVHTGVTRGSSSTDGPSG